MPPIRYLSMEVFIIAIRAYRGHIVREWESVSVFFFVIGVRRHEPLNAGVLMGGGVYFLFDTSDLQMLLLWHDFPVFFLHFFVSHTFLCVCWKIRNSQITVGRKIRLFRSLYVMVCKVAGLEPPPPPPPLTFWKSMLKRKRKKDGEKK